MKHFSFLFFLFVMKISYCQNRLVLSSGIYLVLDNNVKISIDNSNSSAIVNTGSGGIVTEDEFDQVVWYIGSNSGNYQLPFVAEAGLIQIPYSLNVTSSGIGNYIAFSTYPGSNWNNDTYRPSDVTHMFDYFTASVNNSDHVIDRFWIVDINNYSSKPNAVMSFTYLDAEHLAVGNNITESDLGAQRFNAGPNICGDYLPQGVDNPINNQVTNVPVPSTDFFRSWTLSEMSNPLPVVLEYIDFSCNDKGVLFNWKTSSENNFDYFKIEYWDGAKFESLLQKQALNNSNGGIYSAIGTLMPEQLYRLISVELDGSQEVLSVFTTNCKFQEQNAFYDYINQSLTVNVELNFSGIYSHKLYDTSGKLIKNISTEGGIGWNTTSFSLQDLSKGMYLLSVESDQGGLIFSKKIIKL